MSARENESDREMVFTRVFDAPRELVWEAWTNPKHVAQWWGPKGFRTTIEKMDVRPGGVWKLVMHGPDGTDYPNKIVFQEVAKPERLVYTNSGGKKDGPNVQFQATVTLEEENGKTRVTMRGVFKTAAERDLVVKEYGALEGGRQTFERLAEKLERMSAFKLTMPSDRELVMERMFDAPRRLVFEVWTRPEHVPHWFGPHGHTLPVCEIDLRPGGAYRFVNRAPEGKEYPFKGVYREVVPNERLVYTQIYDVEPWSGHELVVTVMFSEHSGRTKVTITTLFESLESRNVNLEMGMAEGAAESLERMAERLKSIS